MGKKNRGRSQTGWMPRQRLFVALGGSQMPDRAQPDSPATVTITKGGPAVDTKTWRCEALMGCPLEKQQTKPDIVMTSEMYYALVDLARAVETEWFGYMQGEMDGRTATLRTVHFPPQKATHTHCEPLEDARAPEGTICAVHSHNTMKAFFSSTDDGHANWPIEIVLNAKGEIAGRMRVPLRCGEYELVNARVLLSGTTLADEYTPALKEALAAGAAVVAAEKAQTQASYTPMYRGESYSRCPVCEKWHEPHCAMTCIKCGNLAHSPGELCSKDIQSSYMNQGGRILELCDKCNLWHPREEACDPMNTAYGAAWGD